MWIVASLPFWFMGGISLLTGMVGILRVAERPKHPRDGPDFCAAVLFLLVAAVMLPVAAKLAS